MRLHHLEATKDTTELETLPFQTEAELETLLHTNPQLLLDEPILIISRQPRLEVGVADLVGLDQFGNVIVWEIKKGRSGSRSASEETILSQPQTYASELSRFSYSDLEELYRTYQTRLKRSEWDTEATGDPESSLKTAFEDRFGNDIAKQDYNTELRMAVVAEEITRRTATNSRFLLEEGLHFQCLEVRRFCLPNSRDEQHFVVSSTIVDYDLDRVRPATRPSPTYPDITRQIVETIFPEIKGLVRAEEAIDVFPDGFDTRTPGLESRHPEHPDGVRYYLAPQPDLNKVEIGLHNMAEDPYVNDRLHQETDLFKRAGLTVKDNTRYNLLWKKWEVENIQEVGELTDEIGELYATMVELGHAVLTEEDPQDSS